VPNNASVQQCLVHWLPRLNSYRNLRWCGRHDLFLDLCLCEKLMQRSSFFLSNTAYERSWTIIPFFIYVLDIWIEMIYDLVTNGLAMLNLPLELNFLCCIGWCQIILALICDDFLILFNKMCFFLDFLRHCFQFCCMYIGISNSQFKKKSMYFWSWTLAWFYFVTNGSFSALWLPELWYFVTCTLAWLCMYVGRS